MIYLHLAYRDSNKLDIGCVFLTIPHVISFGEVAFRGIKCFRRLVPISFTENNSDSVSISTTEHFTPNHSECFVYILTVYLCRNFEKLVEFSFKTLYTHMQLFYNNIFLNVLCQLSTNRSTENLNNNILSEML